LELEKQTFAKLINVTVRAVNLWYSGSRDVPGPVKAYLSLLASLSPELRTQEIARVLKEKQTMYDGMYVIEYQGYEGSGLATIVLQDGLVFGHDARVKYDGTYAPVNGSSEMVALSIEATVPSGVALVQGVPAQPFEHKFTIHCEVIARGDTRQTIQTPFGPVSVLFKFIRPLHRDLAA